MADYTPRMKQRYDDQVVKAMTEKFGYKNALEVPRLEKITLNMGVGEASSSCVKACRSVARSPCAANACTSFSIVW